MVIFMKKILVLFFLVLLMFTLSGCQITDEKIEKTPVKINLPTDDSVNGYRNSSSEIDTDGITINETTTEYTYFGNKNSKKFHKSSCSALKNTKDENKVFYKTKEEFIKNNYSPCKICNP